MDWIESTIRAEKGINGHRNWPSKTRLGPSVFRGNFTRRDVVSNWIFHLEVTFVYAHTKLDTLQKLFYSLRLKLFGIVVTIVFFKHLKVIRLRFFFGFQSQDFPGELREWIQM